MPQLVALCVKRWFGDDADGTAVYSLLKTPKFSAIAALTGTCSGPYIVTAAPPALAPCSAEYLSSCSEYGYASAAPPAANLPAYVS